MTTLSRWPTAGIGITMALPLRGRRRGTVRSPGFTVDPVGDNAVLPPIPAIDKNRKCVRGLALAGLSRRRHPAEVMLTCARQ